MKAYKVTLSGDYLGEDGKKVDFSDIQVIIPAVEEDLMTSAARTRYAPMAIVLSEKYKNRAKKIRGCFIDEMKECDHKFSFIGKDVKELSFEEMQDFATALQLRRIPLWKKTSLREARAIAYVEYSNFKKGTKLSEKVSEFNYANLSPLIIEEEINNKRVFVKNNEEVLEDEAKSKSALTSEDLKNILRERGVKFGGNSGYDTLYNLAFQN